MLSVWWGTCNVQGQEVDRGRGLEPRRFLPATHRRSRILSHDCGHGTPGKVTQGPGQPCSTQGLTEPLRIATPSMARGQAGAETWGSGPG